MATSMARTATPQGPATLEGADQPVVLEGSHSPSRKRKSSRPLSSRNRNGAVRRKITRACDSCKEKKTRCTGTLPCSRCMRLSLACRYNAAYSRGLPPDPLPATSSSAGTASDAGRSNATPSRRNTGGSLSARNAVDTQSTLPGLRHVLSARNSPEPGATDFEGNYLGPASGISFIHRVWSRLHQGETTRIPNEVQNESSKNTAVFMFGDKPYSPHPQDVDFALPSLDKAMELAAVYFDFSMVTYRFLHRVSVERWVRQVYENEYSVLNLPTGNMVARTAIVLMIFAVGTLHRDVQADGTADGRSESERWFAASKHMSSLESGPPRLETIQARLIQCLYLLSSSRANECWYLFGTALQVVTALGLHRKCPVKLSKNGCSYFELELRKRIFWSVSTLDKYLSIMFGRPRLLHDEDIDQELPGETNDEDLLEEDPSRRTGSADSMMIASILHYRLGRILGEISRQLYSINPLPRDSPLQTAVRLTSDLEQWKESIPPLFNSVRPSSLIPPLCRQSQVLQLAYHHAMIHATRSFLLNDFTDLSRRPRNPHPSVSTHVHKCIKAAEEIMTLVDSLAQQTLFIESFWFTQYVCFCAILVVYIHIIQQHRQSTASPADTDKLHTLFSLAETCQHHLAEATRRNCPSRRYSIILEELRQEVHRQISSDGPPSPSSGRLIRGQDGSHVQGSSGSSQNGVDRLVPFEGRAMDFVPGPLQSHETGVSMNPMDDVGFLENLEGSI